MELVQRDRKSFRKQTMKLLELAVEINEEPNIKIKLQSLQIQLQEKRIELKAMDSDILVNTTVDTDVDEEIETAHKYQSDIIEGIQLVQSKLEKLDITRKQGESAEKVEKTITIDGKQKQHTAKLPQLELSTFHGDIMEWTSFWQLFNTTINQREDLATIEKMTYLVSLLKGEAAKCIEGFTMIAENYTNIIEALQERYGDKDKIINFNITKILQLKPITNLHHYELKQLVMEIVIRLRNLDNLGVKTNDCSPVFITKIKEILPPELLMSYARQEKKEDTIGDLIKFLQQELKIRESSQAISRMNPEASPFRPKNPPIRAAPFVIPRLGPPNAARPFAISRSSPRFGPPNAARSWNPRPTGITRPPVQYRPAPPGLSGHRHFTPTCYKCGKPGHLARDCRSS